MEEFYLPHPTWNSLKRGTRNLNSYFSNCDSLMGQPDPFDSTLPSAAPPQAGTAPNAGIDRDTGAIIERIGRLECISNPNDGCFHATPLNSPPNPNLAPLICADPGFTERATRFSKVGSRSCNGLGEVGIGSSSEAGKIPRVSSCQALKFPGSLSGESKDEIQIPERKLDGISRCATLEKGDPIEESSSVSEQITGRELDVKSAWPNDANPRKRKSIPREKKEICQIQEDGSNHDVYAAKRTKSDESNGTEKSGRNGNGKSMDDSKNNFEPPKDYIHVRARRGQATDSHSLAERVRREKISQRMKFLQDLVPGCNKVTGKAVMLDEIINYVQSLQRQVEFLSMKLSTLNPRTDINMEAILSKDLHQASSLLSQSMIALKSSSASAAFAYGYQSQGLSTNNALSIGSEASFSMSPLNSQRRNHGALFPSFVGFEQSASQVSMWIDELHNVVQMGYGHDKTVKAP